MKNYFKKSFALGLTGACCVAMWCGSGVALAAYTDADVDAATTPAALKPIADDGTTDYWVRMKATVKLPSSQLSPYLTAPWVLQGERAAIAYRLHMEGLLKTDQYPAGIYAFIFQGSSHAIALQDGYIKSLLKDGQTDKAVAESKRLLGIAPQEQYFLLLSVNTTAAALKGDALKKGASIKDAIAAMNSYLEAINNKTVKTHPFTALPFPASPPDIAALESSPDQNISALALLYDGKYDEATTKGNAMMIAAVDAEQVQGALNILGAAANGKAGLPDAANALLGDQK